LSPGREAKVGVVQLDDCGEAGLAGRAEGRNYASQFLDPVGRAWRTKAKIKARLIADEDPEAWDLPPKPKRMRMCTYERWEARFDEAEDALDIHLFRAAARLFKRV
jgi:hypothetical protein